MMGSRSTGPADRPFICRTCGSHLGLSLGELKKGVVPWHFDARPVPTGKEREGCPATGASLRTSDEWCSPPEIADPLAEFFHGPVDVDPCSNSRSLIQARVAYEYGGLILPWRLPGCRAKRTGYQNDPYSQAEEWTRKMLAELACGNLQEHVRLSMFSCSAKWWFDMCHTAECNPRILALKRIAFLDPYAAEPGKQRMSCRFEPALTYFGPRVAMFDRAFAHLTRWSTWGRS